MITGKTNFWKYFTPVGALLLVVGSACTKNFDELNTNQHEATEDMMATDNLKTGAFFSQMQRNVVLFRDGINLSSDYQVAQGLTSDVYSGYVAPTGTWYGGVHNGSYYLIPGWIERTFVSGFASVMPAWQSINTISSQQGLPEVAALATIVKVQAMHRVADAYGPIPYLNFGNGTLQATYDPLQDVYARFFQELDGAIDVLTTYAQGNPSSTVMRSYDNIYGGNVTKWVKFANTLRLRLALRVVYANAGLARTEAEKSAANPLGFISTQDERAALIHSPNLVYFHPLYEIAYTFNAGEVRMSASMDAYMNGYDDPRRTSYFTRASDGNFHGVRQGIVTTNWTPYSGPAISNLNINNSTSQIVWMTAAESFFLRAEGALRGWAMGGTAEQFYNQGITASFTENGVAGSAPAYLANTTSVPVAFADNSGQSGNNAPAPSTVTIAWDAAASFETNLERIITQKWLAMFPDGPEGWAEFRRTGYPKLFPVVSNNSNGTINTATQIRRITYPQSEYNNNRPGVQSGLTALGGPDGGGVKLWWDKK
ncbi:SusD/RagB family nutrient-binding outer membrane lipoprotein [Terrimonas sp. NA20]|uniref:SusD/RagB family nutrient-binding outer membrane lipoprotein n=1 Tax=Terrimonas ginsenosidimutans TaxID=2908004 RepID=A0ABS9KLX5_9BACT|nr:RagB/SusD family nutrient uptake outer membrane protein [Terrimonas ginsenosidimutans]MCG2613333.1 SusD/RagB family nutrient-binding outer membrane lipoprotein [Terrimonas ginsenosidimutans]